MFGITETRSAAWTVETTVSGVREIVTEVTVKTVVRLPEIEVRDAFPVPVISVELGAVMNDREGNRFLVTGSMFGNGIAGFDLLCLETGEPSGWKGDSRSWIWVERTRP